MSRHEQFETLAEKVLLTMLSQSPLEFMGEQEAPKALATVALAVTEAFLNGLRVRRDEMDNFDGLLPTEIQMLRDRQKIMAIKSVRERTGMGLKEAKTLVDQIQAQNSL